MNAMTEEQRIAERYKQFGVTPEIVQMLVEQGVKDGLSRKASLISLRQILGKEYGVQEYFTAEDVAEVLGVSVDEVNKLIEENKDELIANGGLAEVSFTPPK